MTQTMRIDLTNQLFGNLRVLGKPRIRRVGKDRQTKTTWLCQCVCGVKVRVQAQSLRSGNTRSCGCLGKATRAYKQSKEEKAWRSMKDRCAKKYKDKGIRVDPRWEHDFKAFLDHIGPAPSLRHSVDRINNKGHYEPGNVRWATPVTQGRNR